MSAISITGKAIYNKTHTYMQLIRSRPDYLKDEDAVQVLAKAVVNGNKILRATANLPEGPTASVPEGPTELVDVALLCDYAQFLLDFSYAIELKIVNGEFTNDYKARMLSVFGYLDETAGILTQLTEPHPKDDIGAGSKIRELLECVYWRKGALLYMYCHTAYHNPDRLLSTPTLKTEFLAYAKDGVRYLAYDMRQARIDDITQEYETKDDQLLLLIKQGIFSDVNMLSLIYAAEMCHWIVLLKETNNCSISFDFDPKTLGSDLATQYIHIANGPLKESNWNIERAVTIENELRSSPNTAR